MKEITTTNFLEEDAILRETLSPKTLEEFIGQEKTKEKLKIFIKAAKQRKEPLDHVLLTGPPGIGKTTLSKIIAHEMGAEIFSVPGPAIEKPFDLAGILTKLSQFSVLFIDEIHRIPRQVEEYLYPAMEKFEIEIIVDKGPAARSVKLKLNYFTLIGATTRMGLLTGPLRSRFGIPLRLDYYSVEELKKIVERSAQILKIEIEPSAAYEIAKRGRGTPRLVNRLLKRVRDFAQVEGENKITLERAKYALEKLEVDELGLNEMDRKILSCIYEKFGGGPVGLKTLSSALDEDMGTIEEVYEPFLIREGLIERTNKGRKITKKGLNYLNKHLNLLSHEKKLF
jgi:Holliday junction DNA helicase RuvB